MIEAGLKFTSQCEVTPSNSAKTLGSGDLEVFATPAMAALMENAAMRCVADVIDDDSTTVGSMISTTHVKPSKIGEHISATATLVDVDGRKLTFKVSASDSQGIIGEGEHVRYVVDRQKFMAKLK